MYYHIFVSLEFFFTTMLGIVLVPCYNIRLMQFQVFFLISYNCLSVSYHMDVFVNNS